MGCSRVCFFPAGEVLNLVGAPCGRPLCEYIWEVRAIGCRSLERSLAGLLELRAAWGVGPKNQSGVVALPSQALLPTP